MKRSLPSLYTRHAEWWPLLSAPADYKEDAAAYVRLLKSACVFKPVTLLELGSGGGNNASFMKRHFRMTLADLSADMLRVSRRLNPACEHVQGDMRTLRLGREFDAVFIHDAIVYMRTRRDLERALATAYIHCRPGGAALFVPDYTTESFRTSTGHGGYDSPSRSMRYLQWDWDPDPADATYRMDFAYLFRDAANRVRVERESHVAGLFSRREWQEIIRNAGFEVDSVTLESKDLEPGHYRLFRGRKPGVPAGRGRGARRHSHYGLGQPEG